MIPRANVLNWRTFAPWANDEQVEQDLILSRILLEFYNDPFLSSKIAFRGGTALHKLFIQPAARHSEDIDLVQVNQGPIGPILDAIRQKLDLWLGIPKRKLNHGRATLLYRYQPVNPTISSMGIKIEINTREHFSIYGLIEEKLTIDNPWVSGTALVKTFTLEELLATKFRALYQRKKGRDLFDLAYAYRTFPTLKIEDVVTTFNHYMSNEKCRVTRAEYEKNLTQKINEEGFREDILPLIPTNIQKAFDSLEDMKIIMNEFIPLLPGDSWKGLEVLN